MPSRLVTTPPGGPPGALMRHVASLASSGHWILVVTAKTPAQTLLDQANAAGVPANRLFVADTVSRPGGTGPTPDPRRALYVSGPSLLELLQLRAESVVWNHGEGKTHIIVHDMNAFALYNPPSALEEMATYVMSRVRPYTVVDFMVDPASPLPASLEKFLTAFCSTRLALDDPLAAAATPP